MKISRAKATSLIRESQGKTISATFTKKNGEERKLNGRTGVYKSPHAPLTGEGLKYTPSDYGLVSIFDMQKKAYRMININTLQSVTIDKATYSVE